MANNRTTYTFDISLGGKVDPSLKKAIGTASKLFRNIDSKNLAKVAKVAVGVGTGLKIAGTVGKAAFHGIAKSVQITADVMEKAVENAGRFEKQMANVSTLLSGTNAEVSARVAELSDDVLKISNVTGVATEDLTDGLYQVISAFGDTEDAARITELAAKSGAAGCATTTDAVNLLSAVTKAYGDTSYEANQKVSDMAFETVKLGQTTYPELANSIQQVTSLSKAMNVSQQELFGVFAAGTGVIGDAAGVATKLKAVYSKLAKPSKELSVAMKKLGYSSGDAMIKQLGLQGALQKLTEYSKETGISLSALYKSSEAAVLATALTGDLSDAWKEKTAAMYTDALGQTDAAFAKQAATYEYTVQMLKNLGQNALTEIGQKLIPYLTEAGQTLLPKVTDALDKLSPVASSVFDNIDWDSLENALDQMLNVSVQLIEQVLPQLGPTLQGATNILNDIWPLVSRIIDALLTLIEYANIGYAMLSGDSGTASAIIANKEAREANAIREKMSDDQKTQAYVQAANRAEKATGATGTKKNVVTVSPPLTGQNTYTFGVGTPAGKAAQIAANASDSITTSGKFGNAIKAVPQATGGIVTRPTFIYAGEGGESEAVLPLSKLDAMLHSSTTNNTQTQTMSFTYAPVIHMHGGNANDVQETLEDGYEEFKRMMYQFERDNDRRKF